MLQRLTIILFLPLNGYSHLNVSVFIEQRLPVWSSELVNLWARARYQKTTSPNDKYLSSTIKAFSWFLSQFMWMDLL